MKKDPDWQLYNPNSNQTSGVRLYWDTIALAGGPMIG